MRRAARFESSADDRDQVLHVLVALHGAQLLDPHAFGLADPRQVIPQQVDDHHVFGPVLLALAQLVAG